MRGVPGSALKCRTRMVIIPGSFNSYSGDFPLWRLSYTIIPYIREKFEHIGLSFQSLFNMPRGMEVPFLTYQQFSNLIGSVVPMIVKEQNWQPIIDTIWATRDETDYVFRNSLVKKEFMRKWSHSQTSVGAMLSLDQLMEDTPDSITAESAPFEEEIIESQTFEAFVATLSERDQQILQFKSEGFTLKEIAAKVGYQNHRKSIPNTETNKSYPIQSSQPAVIVIRQWLLSFAHFYGGTT